MIGRVLAILIFLLAGLHPACAVTLVWLMYGMGDNAFGSSAGIDQIAAAARQIPSVAQVTVANYWQTQQIANAILQSPAGDRIVVGGYSCGANSTTAIAYGLSTVRKMDLATIQESIYCGGFPVLGNVGYAQETYAAGFVGCIITMGFGCKTMEPGPGFKGKLVLIDRPDLHPYADLDTNAQSDVLGVIAGNMSKSFSLRGKGQVVRVTRYNGQRL